MPEIAAVIWFAWVSDSGTLSFTDDEERVPALYHSVVTQMAAPELACYDRATLIGDALVEMSLACEAQDERPLDLPGR